MSRQTMLHAFAHVCVLLAGLGLVAVAVVLARLRPARGPR